MENEQIKRISYVFNDINAIPENERKEFEVLTNYEKLDLVIIGKNGELFSIKEAIADSVKDLLTTEHMRSKNQHNIATTKLSGFMSALDKKLLETCSTTVNELYSIIHGSMETEPFIVSSLTKEINQNELILTNKIKNGNFVISMEGTINIGERPDKSFLNAHKKSGFRDDLVAISIKNNGYEYVHYKDIILSDESIILASQTYNYDAKRHIYCDEFNSLQLIPLFLIRRRNSEIINNNNINGFITNTLLDESEMIDIHRTSLPNITKQKLLIDTIDSIQNGNTVDVLEKNILSTNLEISKSDKAKLFISMNGDDYEAKRNTSLNKGCAYTNSPYGEMMKNAIRVGNLLTFTVGETLRVDFLLKLDGKKQPVQNVIQLKTSLMVEKLLVKYLDNKKIRLVVDGAKISDINLSKKSIYHNISIKLIERSIFVFDNNTIIYQDMLPETIKINEISTLSVPSMSVPIGNIMISEDMSFINTDITNNVNLIERFSALANFDIIENKVLSFKFGDYNLDPNITCEFRMQNHDSFISGDRINIFFDNNLLDYYSDGFTIKSIDNNRIELIGKHNLKIGDKIKITKDNINLDKLYEVIETIENFVFVDDVVPTEYKGFWAVNILSSNVFEATVNSKRLPTNTVNNVVTIYIKETLPLDTMFTIKLVEKTPKSDIIKTINRINSVIVNDDNILPKYNDHIAHIDLNKLNIYFKGEKISGDLSKGLIIEDSNLNNIILDCNIDMRDYFSNLDMKLINLIDFTNGFIRVAVAEDNTLSLNSKEILNHNGKLITYPFEFIDFKIINNELRFKINVRKEKSDVLFLVFKEFNLDLKFKEGDLFLSKDMENIRIVNFLFSNETGIFTNIEQKLNIIITENRDTFTIDNNVEYISEKIDGYVLCKDKFNLVKVENVPTGKIYELKNKYII